MNDPPSRIFTNEHNESNSQGNMKPTITHLVPPPFISRDINPSNSQNIATNYFLSDNEDD